MTNNKIIKHGDDARKAIFEGMEIVNKSVSCTIGPRGRNVALAKSWGGPTLTNDGVSIAREIKLKDPFMNLGADLIKGVAEKTNDSAGDGTSSTVILTHAIASEGLKHLSSGVNVIGLKKGIEKASKAVVEAIKEIAKPIKNDDETKHVATISSESEEIGQIICDTIKKVGNNGIITVEEGQTSGVISEYTQGMDFDRGFVSPYMVTNPEKMESECNNPYILITDYKVSNIQEIVPLLEAMMATGKKEMVIIADEIEGEALHTFVINKIRGIFSVLAIKAPGFGERKKDYLQDIATVTGGTFISSDTGMNLGQVQISDLGQASKVISTKDRTVIVGGAGKKEDIEARITITKNELERIESKHDKAKIEERIAKLSGGVAIIKVGAATETEMKYLKLKIEDAVSATKAALEEGVVPGGGIALIKAKKIVKKPENMSYDEEVGFNIVLNALGAPLQQIATNAGAGDGSSVVERVEASTDDFGGYDALNKVYVKDMIEVGIIDPAKVTRCAIQNASSAAGTFLTTECAVVDEPKVEKEI